MQSNMIFGLKPNDKCIKDFSLKTNKKETTDKAAV
jgi:hypothetical protein